ncbi:DUF1834 family protein [Escherichia coli]|uniref:DUF1834 family protein n=1 Tax=Escherichia coli TaxID=562 RepID=UPI000B7E8041|nr:DUF1834 family protein [Escherichia coli]EJA1174452.1 DUF1834 family protein [Escherichia coli]EJD9549930.1 DUF1834 family protein [Escherichia coli]EJD9572596.1 DUF1834 family protein [Escherichia coli]EJG7545141.1 DUF1834 family protein [Escherichia coli]EKM1660972.1 DUF1834 family protein [Escherichia coli]
MITETEQAYISRIREYFGNGLVLVDTHPGDWSDSVLRTMLINAPAVYVAWLGASEGRIRGRLVSHWVFYVIGDMLNGREVSRPGLYQIVGRLLAVLNGFKTDKTSPLYFEKAVNGYTDIQADSGAVMYALYFSCEEMIDPLTDISSLDEFLRHHETFTEPEGTAPFKAHISLRDAPGGSDDGADGDENHSD